MNTSSDALTVTGLRVRFGGLTAVDDVSFSVAPKEIVGLIGPNGAGKTTVLNALSGLVRADAGALTLFGEDIRTCRATAMIDRGMARTFQAPRFIMSRSILENVKLGGYRRFRTRALGAVLDTPHHRKIEQQCSDEAMRALVTCKVSDWADKLSAEVPYGVLKLAEIARAISSMPKLLLLDEPVAGTTKEERRWIGEVLLDVTQEIGCSILVIDHDIEFIAGFCSRLLVMDFGKKIAEGLPNDVIHDKQVREAYLGAADEHE